MSKYFWGVDCGSTQIKVAVMNGNGDLLALGKTKTLFPLLTHVQSLLNGSISLQAPMDNPPGALSQPAPAPVPFPFDKDGNRKPNHRIVVTGYGRSHLAFGDDKLTEIKAHALGVAHQLSQRNVLTGTSTSGTSAIRTSPNNSGTSDTYTIIDIGGQDSKVITARGAEVQNFIINRKCAAGTGAYVEELAHRLQIPLEQMSDLAQKADKDLTLNSYCTVFAGQEVIRILMEGERVENLIYALYQSVVKRIFEMTPINTNTVVFSGGVLFHHPTLREFFKAKLGTNRIVLLAPEAQFCGAIGAAEQARI